MMIFDPAVHTKEFLLSNADFAVNLARESRVFSVSNLAQDLDVLKIQSVDFGFTVAHRLAEYQSSWLSTEAAKNHYVLRLENGVGWTVAHTLASHQPDWLKSDASKDFDVLRLTNVNGWAVAHALAVYQPSWPKNSAIMEDFNLLRLQDDEGFSVAHLLVSNHPENLHNEKFFHKKVLSLECKGQLLAEFISERYNHSNGLDITTMAMKLIAQGAAYKHSKPIGQEIGEQLITQIRSLLSETIDPLISFKQLQALYSTLAHAVVQNNDLKDAQATAEAMLRQHVDTHSELFDIPHTVDMFCEPGDDLLRKIMAERTLTSTLSDASLTEHTHPTPEQGLY
jgi:hypothetical protein